MSATPPKTTAETFFDNLGDEMKDAWSRFGSSLKLSLTDTGQIAIQTNDSTGTTLYKTTVNLDGSVLNEFQATKPDPSDPYWTRHNAEVDQAIENRNAMMQKIIETVGGVFKITV